MSVNASPDGRHRAVPPVSELHYVADEVAQVLTPTEGTWQSGVAGATANTYQMAEWVAQASATSGVRLAITRK